MTRSNGTGRPKCYKDELIVLDHLPAVGGPVRFDSGLLPPVVVEESLRWEGYGLWKSLKA